MNCLIEIADNKKRDYVTPEDVSDALRTHTAAKVREDLLEVLGKTTKYGWEDFTLCCYIAHRGTP